jgi:hypothetical protein
MKHIYVFGAGASKASANTPLGRELAWNYHIDCMLLVPNNNGHPDLSEENENFSNFYRFLQLAASIYPEFKFLLNKWENRGTEVFDLYNKLEKKHYVDEMLDILQQKGDKQGIELVRRLIFEHLVESAIGSPNQLYKRFVESLKNNTSQQVTIISFNFDFLLQEDNNRNIYFDYLLKFDWIDQYRKETYTRTNPIKLIKPNGSLDWGICPSCNRLYLYIRHISRHFYDDKKCSEGCGEHIQPFIIIPHERYSNIIETLWSSAKNELEQADKVTIIGYSFPDYDKKVVELFSSSLNPNVKLEIADHCTCQKNEAREKNAILMKYRRLFPALKTEIDIHLNGFEGYINNHTN